MFAAQEGRWEEKSPAFRPIISILAPWSQWDEARCRTTPKGLAVTIDLLLLLYTSNPPSGVKHPVIRVEICPLIKLILPWELFRHGLCALISLFQSSVGVWTLWVGVVVRWSSVLRGLRVFLVWLLFEVFGKCGARPAHEQQVSPHALLGYTFCLCVHYELFLPRVRWVQTNLIFCLYQFLDWLLTFVWTITNLVPLDLLSLKDSPVDILEPSFF